MEIKKKRILLIMAFLVGYFICACGKKDSVAGDPLVEDPKEQWAKGYDLPVDEQEEKEAENEIYF